MLKGYLICRYALNLVEEAISCRAVADKFFAGRRIAFVLLNFVRFMCMECLGGVRRQGVGWALRPQYASS
jgi:hypothetical protein